MTGREAARYRRELGMTQVQFAALVLVSQSAVSQWETGATEPTKVQAEMIRIKAAEARKVSSAVA